MWGLTRLTRLTLLMDADCDGFGCCLIRKLEMPLRLSPQPVSAVVSNRLMVLSEHLSRPRCWHAPQSILQHPAVGYAVALWPCSSLLCILYLLPCCAPCGTRLIVGCPTVAILLILLFLAIGLWVLLWRWWGS